MGVASEKIRQMFSCMAMSGSACQDTKIDQVIGMVLFVTFVAGLLAMAIAGSTGFCVTVCV